MGQQTAASQKQPSFWTHAIPVVATWSILIAWVATLGVSDFEGGRAMAMAFLAIPASFVVLLIVAVQVNKASKRSDEVARRVHRAMSVLALVGLVFIGLLLLVSVLAKPAMIEG